MDVFVRRFTGLARVAADPGTDLAASRPGIRLAGLPRSSAGPPQGTKTPLAGFQRIRLSGAAAWQLSPDSTCGVGNYPRAAPCRAAGYAQKTSPSRIMPSSLGHAPRPRPFRAGRFRSRTSASSAVLCARRQSLVSLFGTPAAADPIPEPAARAQPERVLISLAALAAPGTARAYAGTLSKRGRQDSGRSALPRPGRILDH